MTKLLAEAFKKASELPDELQDELAQSILLQLEWELKWDDTFAGSQGVLEKMADKALADHRAGRTAPGGFGDE